MTVFLQKLKGIFNTFLSFPLLHFFLEQTIIAILRICWTYSSKMLEEKKKKISLWDLDIQAGHCYSASLWHNIPNINLSVSCWEYPVDNSRDIITRVWDSTETVFMPSPPKILRSNPAWNWSFEIYIWTEIPRPISSHEESKVKKKKFNTQTSLCHESTLIRHFFGCFYSP